MYTIVYYMHICIAVCTIVHYSRHSYIIWLLRLASNITYEYRHIQNLTAN